MTGFLVSGNVTPRLPACVPAICTPQDFILESPEKLTPCFAKIDALMSRHAYPPSLVFNMDETGFAIGAAGQLACHPDHHRLSKLSQEGEQGFLWSTRVGDPIRVYLGRWGHISSLHHL